MLISKSSGFSATSDIFITVGRYIHHLRLRTNECSRKGHDVNWETGPDLQIQNNLFPSRGRNTETMTTSLRTSCTASQVSRYLSLPSPSPPLPLLSSSFSYPSSSCCNASLTWSAAWRHNSHVCLSSLPLPPLPLFSFSLFLFSLPCCNTRRS